MINPTVQAWLGTTGARMMAVAESNDAKAMYEVIADMAGQIDKYVTPARVASERITLENEGILT